MSCRQWTMPWGTEMGLPLKNSEYLARKILPVILREVHGEPPSRAVEEEPQYVQTHPRESGPHDRPALSAPEQALYPQGAQRGHAEAGGFPVDLLFQPRGRESQAPQEARSGHGSGGCAAPFLHELPAEEHDELLPQHTVRVARHNAVRRARSAWDGTTRRRRRRRRRRCP